MIGLNKWDRRFMALAAHVATWSKDPNSKVGAVIARQNKQLGVGINGFPPCIPDREEWLNNRETKNRLMVHAEENAIADAVSKGRLVNSTIYTYPFAPCGECAKQIALYGISRSLAPQGRYCEEAEFVFKKAGIEYHWLTKGECQEILECEITQTLREENDRLKREFADLQVKYGLLTVDLENIVERAKVKPRQLYVNGKLVW